MGSRSDAVPLSQTPLWAAQTQFYRRAGPEIFRTGTLPYHVTSNPAIAHAYAQLIAAWVSGLRAEHVASALPLTVLEIGPGPGRLAFLLLSELKRMLPECETVPAVFQYVCADVSAGLLDSIESHPANQEWVRSGILRVARVDAGRPGEWANADPVLARPGGALVVVANYFFDSLPQDAYHVSNGQLFDMLVRVEGDVSDAGVEPVSRWRLSFEQRAARPRCYDDASLNEVLGRLAAAHEGALLFPVGGLECLRGLNDLAAGRPLMMLVADKGCTPGAAMTQRPHLEYHGDECFSMAVNFEALERFWETTGGVLKRSTSSELLSFRVFHARLGERATAALDAVFAEHFERGAPDDWFLWSLRVGRDVHTYSLAEMMAALRLSRYDPAVLNDCYTMMFRLLPSAAEQDRMSLRTILWRVREHYFFVGEHPDAAFVVGSLLYAMGDYVEALDCLRQSERLNGPLAATLFQQARCCYHLGDKKMALDTLRACRAMPADFEQFLVLAGILDAPRASEFEQQLAWEVALGEAASSGAAQ